MIQIKNRYNGNVIKEVESLRDSDLRGSDLSDSDLRDRDLRGSDLRHSALSGSDLRGSDLRGVDLRYSDLRGSDLRNSALSGSDLSYSDLRGIIGNGREVKSLQIGTYLISYHKDILNIGCQTHTLDKWINFTDEEIDAMDRGTSLDWWKLNKDILVTLVKREIQ